MTNLKYNRSRAREQQIKNQMEKEGWYCVRAAGSKGLADCVAIRQIEKCFKPDHFEVKFIQVKTSKKFKKRIVDFKVVDSSCGPINLEIWKFPGRG